MKQISLISKKIQFFDNITKELKSNNPYFDRIYIIIFIYYNNLEIIEKFDYDFYRIYNSITKIEDSSIANGDVYRIYESGNLEKSGYEKGYLFLKENSCILEHKHLNEKEYYKVIHGDNKVGKTCCNINESHKIDKVSKDTLVRIYKYIPEYKRMIN